MKAIVIEESGPWSLTFSFHHSTAPLQLRAVSSVTRAEAGTAAHQRPPGSDVMKTSFYDDWGY